MRSLLVVLSMVVACSGPATGNGGGGGGSSQSGGGVSGSGGGTASSGGGTSISGGGTSSSGGGTSSSGGGTSQDAGSKSPKRGIAYDLASTADLDAISGGVTWFYNWSLQPKVSGNVEYIPMVWGGSFADAAVSSWLHAHPEVHYLLVLNEPNLTSQSNTTPQAAAQLWPRYEAIASDAGVKIVGPAITWGTLPGYEDPVAWLDAFYAAYQSAHADAGPQIDYLAFHWYDYGLGGQLDRLVKYGKPFWVTEMANWHSQNDGAQIDTLAKQEAQMMQMVQTCESRSDVFRYAWFTGRWSPDPHFTSLLADAGELTELGQLYLAAPH